MATAIFVNTDTAKFRYVYSDEIIGRIGKKFELISDKVYSREDILASPCPQVEVIFSTWGMEPFSDSEIASLFPNLRAVFYAAGTVQGFARPFLERKISVSTSWVANAVPVAEYTVAQMVLASKGMFAAITRSRSTYEQNKAYSLKIPGFYDIKIGIVGAGAIGLKVIELLRGYSDNRLEILVSSRSMTPERAAALGVRKATVAEIFAQCDIISNHLANNSQTVGMLNARLFGTMKPAVVFINTGRGAQVDEAALIKELESRPDACAILDVTYPEPPEEGHPFYIMPNVFLTPHIAGSQNHEVQRLAEYMLAEAEAWLEGRPMQYSVSLEMLESMA